MNMNIFFFKGSLVYCIKRDLYEDFVDKYVIFVRINNFKKLMYELFDGRFFKYVKIWNRRKYFFIVVIVKKLEKVEEKRRLFLDKFDVLILVKIRIGGCKVKWGKICFYER